MVTHGNLELASRESGVRLAECRRDEYTVVLFKIHVVENVESVPGEVNTCAHLLGITRYSPSCPMGSERGPG